jgi:hypothetical protein
MRVWVINEQYGELYWILETKGRVWERLDVKDNAMMRWCQRISEQTGKMWQFSRINQVDFETVEPKTLMEFVRGFESRKGKLFS